MQARAALVKVQKLNLTMQLQIFSKNFKCNFENTTSQGGIMDVMEEVGYWTNVEGLSLYCNNGESGKARLLHESPVFVERCASVVRR